MRVAKNSWQEKCAAANRQKQKGVTSVCAKFLSGLASRPEPASDALSQGISQPKQFPGRSPASVRCGLALCVARATVPICATVLFRGQPAELQLANPPHG